MTDPNALKYEPDVLDNVYFPIPLVISDSEESDDPDWDLKERPRIWYQHNFTKAEAPSPLDDLNRALYQAPKQSEEWVTKQMAELAVEAQKQKSPIAAESEQQLEGAAASNVFSQVPPVYTPHQPLGEWSTQQPPLKTPRVPSPVREKPSAPPEPPKEEDEEVRYFHGAPVPPPFDLPPDVDIKREDLPTQSLPTPAELQRALAPANLTGGEKCSPDPYIPPGYHPYERLRPGAGNLPPRMTLPQPGPSTSRDPPAPRPAPQRSTALQLKNQQPPPTGPSQQHTSASTQQAQASRQQPSPPRQQSRKATKLQESSEKKQPEIEEKSIRAKRSPSPVPNTIQGESPPYEAGSPTISQRSPC